MRNSRIVGAAAVIGIFATATFAQQPGNGRKTATQVLDRGIDDEARIPPGQARSAPASRPVSSTPVTVLSNGVAVAELDESFDEAIVLTVHPDGTRTFTEVRGRDAAAAVVQSPPPATPAAPALEEK